MFVYHPACMLTYMCACLGNVQHSSYSMRWSPRLTKHCKQSNLLLLLGLLLGLLSADIPFTGSLGHCRPFRLGLLAAAEHLLPLLPSCACFARLYIRGRPSGAAR
jgi:hypothetical protein